VSPKSFLVVVVVVGALVAGVIYMHRPRVGAPARLPQTLHGIR
jgi:hypothetical protein